MSLSRLTGRDKPLALYVYAKNTDLVQQVISETSSGSVCVNHNAVQLAVPGLPFGGVGRQRDGRLPRQGWVRDFQPRQVGAVPARARRAAAHVPAVHPRPSDGYCERSSNAAAPVEPVVVVE